VTRTAGAFLRKHNMSGILLASVEQRGWDIRLAAPKESKAGKSAADYSKAIWLRPSESPSLSVE
jgi:hypothetical protein